MNKLSRVFAMNFLNGQLNEGERISAVSDICGTNITLVTVTSDVSLQVALNNVDIKTVDFNNSVTVREDSNDESSLVVMEVFKNEAGDKIGYNPDFGLVAGRKFAKASKTVKDNAGHVFVLNYCKVWRGPINELGNALRARKIIK